VFKLGDKNELAVRLSYESIVEPSTVAGLLFGELVASFDLQRGQRSSTEQR
jgi:hypothetical protein